MTDLTPVEANDEIATLLNTAWIANTPTIVGSGSPVELRWQNVGKDTRPPISDYWARASILHFGGDHFTLGASGYRRYERTGSVIVQVFSPLGVGVTIGLQLATVALTAFEGQVTPGGVWFRGCGIRSIGRNEPIGFNSGVATGAEVEPWDQHQFQCTFTYDERK